MKPNYLWYHSFFKNQPPIIMCFFPFKSVCQSVVYISVCSSARLSDRLPVCLCLLIPACLLNFMSVHSLVYMSQQYKPQSKKTKTLRFCTCRNHLWAPRRIFATNCSGIAHVGHTNTQGYLYQAPVTQEKKVQNETRWQDGVFTLNKATLKVLKRKI